MQAENGLLTIRYEKKEEKVEKEVKTIRREFAFQSFKRSFSLDDKIDTVGIQAKYENGVLYIVLPKKEALPPAQQKIVIQ